MINRKLICPKSIAVIGGSDDTCKPGGTVLKNLISNKFKGNIYVVNPKAGETVQGCKAFRSASDLPLVDLAILAIPAKFCPDTVDILCNQKNCGAIIIISAGFAEDSPEGAILEKKIVDITNAAGASLIGPNCVGVITPNYAGVFTQPIPHLAPRGIDFISGSGATIVFILETGMQFGLRFASVFSIGNCAQIGVEDVLEYLDDNYVPGESAPVKMLYIESINNPAKLLKHASSLARKGARICAIKAGYSEAGSRAASSHTGAMATPDKAVTALFRKAGIVRCYSRTELVTVAAIMMFGKPAGKKFGIITHAGGPAVMLTDSLTTNGIQVPHFSGEKADALLAKLYKGSSVGNPVDFLSTGTAEQMRAITMAMENDFDVDAMCIIFGKPGLGDLYGITDEIMELQKECKKPIYPILTSVVNASDEIRRFQEKGGISFPEEVQFGQAYAKIMNAPAPIEKADLPPVDRDLIRKIVDTAGKGYLPPDKVQELLDAAGIMRAKEFIAHNISEALKAANEIEGPVAMKVVGPIHKSDVGGVTLNVSDNGTVKYEFQRMMKIPDAIGVLIQPMLTGTQIFVGAKRENKFGHIIMCGLGGIYVEVLHDVSTGLSPISQIEANEMIHHLRSYPLIRGIRGQEGVNETILSEVIRRVSALCNAAPEIFEMDINPLMGNSRQLVAVDTRIRIEKE
ncbi:MAG: acetate--CoA ligase family protein [Bacteroidales bacterium]|jgi:acetyltransferase|nr:acetate--CoA ligase family protein [Bacteroidales bacterium]MCI2122147.1 acetate--CoA ligase family protein [Bacteroidales bacterium]MCI2146174.1 acetate--CoA ligase family protein [Bacteroidales bacterium]